jgi:hypothetical protein
MDNPLIEKTVTEDGQIIYRIKTFEIDVIAHLTGGIAPTISYMHNDKDVTDAIRAIRFQYDNPASYIKDYAKFQTMLYEKEQCALNELYETISFRPKNMSKGKQILWSFFVFSLVMLPLFVVFLIK